MYFVLFKLFVTLRERERERHFTDCAASKSVILMIIIMILNCHCMCLNYRETVRLLLAHLDPEGTALRKRWLNRRIYINMVKISFCMVNIHGIILQGPNFVWHLDGYDKIRTFYPWMCRWVSVCTMKIRGV